MIIEAVPFRSEHFYAITKISPPNGGGIEITPEMLKCMEKENSFTLLVDGVPVALGGTIRQWTGNYAGFAYITKAAAPHMLRITRYTRKILDAAGCGRIMATVQVGFDEGQRWAKMLRFEVETPVLKQWGPDGSDHTLFCRIQG